MSCLRTLRDAPAEAERAGVDTEPAHVTNHHVSGHVTNHVSGHVVLFLRARWVEEALTVVLDLQPGITVVGAPRVGPGRGPEEGRATADVVLADLVRTVRVLPGARDAPACCTAAGGPLRTRQLTRRELEVVALIDEALTNVEIARTLHIEVSTVKNHVHNVLGKLGLRRRAEAAAWFRQHLPPAPLGAQTG